MNPHSSWELVDRVSYLEEKVMTDHQRFLENLDGRVRRQELAWARLFGAAAAGSVLGGFIAALVAAALGLHV